MDSFLTSRKQEQIQRRVIALPQYGHTKAAPCFDCAPCAVSNMSSPVVSIQSPLSPYFQVGSEPAAFSSSSPSSGERRREVASSNIQHLLSCNCEISLPLLNSGWERKEGKALELFESWDFRELLHLAADELIELRVPEKLPSGAALIC